MTGVSRGPPALISVVAPVFNEREGLREFVRRVVAVLEKEGSAFEILLVDDGSTDDSFAVIEDVAGEDGRIHGLRLSRNMGAQVAILCGLQESRGDVAITIDSDLQHPPEHITDMLAAWREGADVVLMDRRSTGQSGFLRSILTAAFYRLFNLFPSAGLSPASTDFRLLDARCVAALRQLSDRNPFLRGMVAEIGFQQRRLEFDSPPRAAGVSGYTLPKLFGAALDAFFSYSRGHLILPVALGGTSLAAAVAAMFFLKWWPGITPEMARWAGVLALLYMGSSILLALALIALYLHRISARLKGGPAWFVERRTDAPRAPAVEAVVKSLRG
jgi:dolichol-phosphate mannosyltransferase